MIHLHDGVFDKANAEAIRTAFRQHEESLKSFEQQLKMLRSALSELRADIDALKLAASVVPEQTRVGLIDRLLKRK